MLRGLLRSAAFLVSLEGIVLVGCGGDSAFDPSVPGDAGQPSSPDESVSVHPDGTGALRDRCFGPVCEPVVMPAQAERPFLDDAGDGWQRLIEADWQLGPRSEGYRCVYKTLPQDVYIVAFSPLTPLGTHHTTVEIGSGTGQNGVTWCSAPSAGGARRLQGSGVGTKPVDLPAGVAMKIAKGEQLIVNLHLFNAGDTPLTGTSGMWIKTVPADDAVEMAEVLLAGPVFVDIPEGRVTQRGRCTFEKPATVYSLGPHMHRLGVHMRVTAHSSIAGERVLYDAPYDFTHQFVYPVEQVELAAGDWLAVECTYDNDTGSTVYWGDSTLSEMCFVNVGRYPAAGGSICAY